MSYTLVDHHDISVGRYVGPGGVPMIQVEVHFSEGRHAASAYTSMTLAEFHVWLCDLFNGLFKAAMSAGDPPDPLTLAALERALNLPSP